MAKKTYELTIEPLTGVHIGTGEELTLLDYTIRKLSENKHLYVKFSSDAILARLQNEGKNLNEFYAAIDSRDMKKVYKFFHNNLKVPDDVDYPCDVTEDFLNTYNANEGKDPLQNAAYVWQMYRPAGTNTPVIPGSSLKGAIRTAILHELLYDENKQFRDGELKKINDMRENTRTKDRDNTYEKKLQKKLLGNRDEKDDPFRAVSISDAAFEARDTQLVGRMKNISVKLDRLVAIDKLQIQAEIIRGSIIKGKASSKTSISIDEGLQKESQMHRALSMEEIAKKCNDFFWYEFDEEYKKFYKDMTEHIYGIKKLKKRLEAALQEENTFIIRVGRWSQVEFVTFEDDFRAPAVPMRKGRSGSYGDTRTVFEYGEYYIPLGWCTCTYRAL